MRYRTRFILTVLFVATGAGTGYAWKADVFSQSLENQEPRVIKKKTAVKPQNLKELLKEVVAAPKVRQDFTFFDTLNDVSLARYVNLKGEVVEKDAKLHIQPVIPPHVPKINTPEHPESVPVPEAAAILEPKIEALEKPALVKLAKTQPPKKPSVHKKVSGKDHDSIFRVQVSSFRESNMARSQESHLKKKGYPAFFKAVTLEGKGTWYRVYLGEYSDKKEAQKAAQLAREKDRLKPVVIRTAAN